MILLKLCGKGKEHESTIPWPMRGLGAAGGGGGSNRHSQPIASLLRATQAASELTKAVLLQTQERRGSGLRRTRRSHNDP
jgi:hypothetical protein